MSFTKSHVRLMKSTCVIFFPLPLHYPSCRTNLSTRIFEVLVVLLQNWNKQSFMTKQQKTRRRYHLGFGVLGLSSFLRFNLFGRLLGVDGLLDVLDYEWQSLERKHYHIAFVYRWFSSWNWSLAFSSKQAGAWYGWYLFRRCELGSDVFFGPLILFFPSYFSLVSLLQFRFDRKRVGLGVPPSLESYDRVVFGV